MDAEFIEFLDKKFQKVDINFHSLENRLEKFEHRFEKVENRLEKLSQEIQNVRSEFTLDIKTLRDEFNERIGHVERTLEFLMRSIDRFIKLHEDVVTEQASFRSDIDRIKIVLKGKLGVQL